MWPNLIGRKPLFLANFTVHTQDQYPSQQLRTSIPKPHDNQRHRADFSEFLSENVPVSLGAKLCKTIQYADNF